MKLFKIEEQGRAYNIRQTWYVVAETLETAIKKFEKMRHDKDHWPCVEEIKTTELVSEKVIM